MKKLVCLLLCVFIGITFLPGCGQKDEEEDKLEEVTVIVNGKEWTGYKNGDEVTIGEMLELTRAFHLHGSQFPLAIDMSKEYSVEATEDTEKIAALLSYCIWDEDGWSEKNKELCAKAESFGLSSENRLTADWVVNNVDLAYELSGYVSEGTWVWMKSNLDKRYDECILGITDEETSGTDTVETEAVKAEAVKTEASEQ